VPKTLPAAYRSSLAEFPLVVAGSGFFGATVARRLAADYGLPVLVVEKRGHIGGNAYSKVDTATGIEYHVYGSHIFHTSNQEVWDFIGKFTRFNNYRHRVLTKHGGRVFTMPINLATINAFYGKNLTPQEARDFLAAEIARDSIPEPANLEEKAISLIGRPLYNAFVRGYTHKQWEIDPRELPAETITRLPVRLNYNDFYFSDLYEGIPVDGYARIFDRMLDHERILIKTGCDYFDIADQLSPNAVIVYTGPIDAYFRFRLGPLGWRTLDLELERPATGDFQGTTVMNYADTEVKFTRIHEFRHYHPERRHGDEATLIMREYSRVSGRDDEPYYPINTPADKSLYDHYREAGERERRTIFGGRLGTYRYLDMHQAIGAALNSVEHEIVPRLKQFGHL
jgi:UDP-galactopyranose mutase